ncbi:MAG TPA: HAMP domain-containing sensor histidine kinase [Candidatus Acidoferrales bacterium]|nr:HAMP domain-containing sensor histidine kinase [Candidatus Acidoferrales bacterium]
MNAERSILDSLGSGLVVLDAQDRIVLLNRTLADMLHVPAEEWPGRPAAELLGLMARYALPVALPRFDWPELFGSREIEWRDAETLRYFREDSSPLVPGAGRVFAYHDVSHEKAVDRMKSEFISVASHELRTPMTSIKGSVDLILSGFAGETSPEMQELLEIAQKSCDRLVRLVNDILDLSKIEAGQLKLNLERLDLTEIAVRAVCAVKPLADKTQVRLRVERRMGLPMLEADPDRIEQAITNLLSNAVKFSPPKAEVVVQLSADETWVQCAVQDQGVGIAEKDLHRIFGKFQQLSEGRRRGGTGLGLAITRGLIDEHRGSIWVESHVGEGSRFIFRLPIESPHAPGATALAGQSAKP